MKKILYTLCFLFFSWALFLGFNLFKVFSKDQICLAEIKNKTIKLESDLITLQKKMAINLKNEKDLGLPSNVSSDQAQTLIKLQQDCKNTVVKVVVDQLIFNMAEPYRAPKQEEVFGSGFFIDEEGFILTNYHVIGFSIKVAVQLAMFGKEKFGCEVVGVCPDRDLALLKLMPESYNKIVSILGHIQYLVCGDSDKVKRGERVLTLGFPLAKDVVVSTAGIVSGWSEVPVSEKGGILSCLQIDASINPGNSGGPSVNSLGEVIGINFAGVSNAQNVGYMLPINELKSAIKNLKHTKMLHKPELGIYKQISTEDIAYYLKSPILGGIYVRNLLKHSLADIAGIKSGDLILYINGYKIDHYGDIEVPWREDKVSFINILHRLEPGEEIELIVLRDGKEKKLIVELPKEPFRPKIRMIYPGYDDIDYEIFGGLVLRELTLFDVIEYSKYNSKLIRYADPEKFNTSVLFVSFIQHSSQAHLSKGCVGIGDMIVSVDGYPVDNLEDFRKEIILALREKRKFIRIELEDKSLVVFSLEKVLSDEMRLQRIFKYDMKNSVVAREIYELGGVNSIIAY